MIWGLSVCCAFSGYTNFSQQSAHKSLETETYYRLLSIFSKNKYGYNTRFMSDFEIFLEAVLNERFLDESVAYYQDALTSREVEDQESGLAGDFAHSDVQNLIHDVHEHSHDPFTAVAWPDRVGTNYGKGDELSCYKIKAKKL